MPDTVLQFSGGKDSLACLYLYEDQWDEIYVMWINTGAAYPELEESMARWKARLPHFVEVKGNQPEHVRKYGWPSDVVPISYTAEARDLLSLQPEFLVQSHISCCSANLWMPGWRAIKELGARRVIRGQRKDEDHKGVIRNGTVFEGIEFVCPLEDWSAEDVFSYLKGIGAEIPPYYGAGEVTSRDCWDCTAFLDVSSKRIDNLPEERRREVKRRLSLMSRAVIEESKWLKADMTPTLPA